MSSHSILGTNSRGYHLWVEQVTGLPNGTEVGPIHAVDSNIVWAGVWADTYVAVIHTTNGGTNWICDTINIDPVNYWIRGIDAVDGNRCWVTMPDVSGATGGGIFRTTNGGVTWTQDSIAYKTAGGYVDFLHFFDANNGVVVGDPTNGYFEIYTTSNGGASWSRVPSANIPAKLAQEWGSDVMFSAAGSSLWFPTMNNAGGTGRYYRTTDKGLTWSVHVYSAAMPTWFLAFGLRDDNVVLANGGWGEVSRTTDGGSNWTRISSPSHLGFSYQIAYVPGTPSMYIAEGVWQYPSLRQYPSSKGRILGTAYTTDGGVNWTRACTVDAYYYLSFVSSSAGWRQGAGENIYKWTMGQGRVIGTSVDTLNFDTLGSGKMSDTIAVDAINYGSDSLTVTGIATPGNQFSVVTQPAFPARIPPLGSVSVGVLFAPHKNGALQDSLVFLSNASNASRATIYLQGTGTGATAIEPASEMPKAFALLQNYPNPFNPSTTIKLELPKSSVVRLSVFDILGREVSVLVNERRDAGAYEVKFDGSNLASGVYFYRLQAGSFVQTRKLLLLR